MTTSAIDLPGTHADRDASPGWLARDLYPFAPHGLAVAGGRLHYVDEGRGDPILFVHGTPTWSFLWRHLVARLRATHRCVAPDHLGFGLSDKPAGRQRAGELTPAAHAANLKRLIAALDLRRLTLVVHDFGGPIGLDYALDHPENVARIVVVNSWMWANEEAKVRRLSGFLAGFWGRALYLGLGAATKLVLPAAFAQENKLTPSLRAHYHGPFLRRQDRLAPWVLGRELWASNPFYDSLWQRRGRLARTPMLIAWGERDIAFKEKHLARWQAAFPHAQVARFPRAGHFVPEEEPEALGVAIERFVSNAR